MMGREELEAPAKAAQHAEPEHVHLEDPERLEVVLVPLDHGAIGHGGRPDRDHLVEPSLPDDEPPGVLGEVAREPDEGPGHGEGVAQPGRPGVEPEGAHRLVVRHLAASVGGEERGHPLGQPENLPRLAEGEPGPEVDHRRGERGAVPPPPFVHVLDHLLPALVLEVDVDVRRLAPLLGHEAFEEEIALIRVDGGDPEHVAHRGVGRRPPPLGEDLLRACEADEVVHGEEVRRVAESGDDRELALELALYRGGDPEGVALARSLPHRLLEPGHGGTPVGAGLVRVVEAELVEGEADPAGDVQGGLDRPGTVPEKARHLGRRLEPALGILEKAEAHLVDAPAGAKAGEHVGDGVPVRPVHEDRVGRDEGDSGRSGGAYRLFFPCIVRRRRQPAPEREPHLPGKGRSPGGEERGEVRFRTVRRQHDQYHPPRRGEEIVGAEHPVPGFAFALRLRFPPSSPSRTRPAPRFRFRAPPPRSCLALGQQPGQPPVGGPITHG